MSALIHKIDEFYWHAWYDEVTAKVEIDQYGLRSIRKGRAYFTMKIDGITWGKRSKTNGDFGWLPKIPALFRFGHRIDSKAIQRYARTKAQAIRASIADERRSIVMWNDNTDQIADCEVAIAALQTRLKRTKT